MTSADIYRTHIGHRIEIRRHEFRSHTKKVLELRGMILLCLFYVRNSFAALCIVIVILLGRRNDDICGLLLADCFYIF